ncbi:neuropathy target esterase-like isoform X1 [Acanthaster planci]|uniref:lysophospholipase n=1 Tax=Acanthaster planci TaxID=133434 RepID=A0A8B7XZP9_ACAPL|nr:neuropathy target esterase-like isoform X1 [Acanthaster planci]
MSGTGYVNHVRIWPRSGLICLYLGVVLLVLHACYKLLSWYLYVTMLLSLYEQTVMTVGLIVGVLVAAILICAIIRHRRKLKLSSTAQPAGPKPRFRKREKFMFYGRKMLRKVRSISGAQAHSARRQVRKRRDYINLAKSLKNILQNDDGSIQPVLQVKEPPPAILEADPNEMQLPPELHIPPEVLYMLKNIRVFGHFEQPLFLELCRSVETKFVPAGAFLFRRGQPDDSIFVVQCGRLCVFITEPDGHEFQVKEVLQGDSVHSLLSVLDVITGHPNPYKTVSAKATEDTMVLRLPVRAFQSVFERYPESLVRVVQMMVVRLQRVTFQTLHNLLGLSSELINREDISDPNLAIHVLTRRASSPVKKPSTASIGSNSSDEAITKVTHMDNEKDALKKVLSLDRSGGTSASDSDQEFRNRSGSAASMRAMGRINPLTGRPRSHSLAVISLNVPSGQKKPKPTSLEVDTTGRLLMSTSDFQAAAGRARVHGLDDSKPHKGSSGKPPDLPRSASEDLGGDPLMSPGSDAVFTPPTRGCLVTSDSKMLQDDLPGPSGTDSGSDVKGLASASPRVQKRVTIAEGYETNPSEKKRNVSGDNTLYSDEEIQEMARKDLVRILGLEDGSILDEHANIAHIQAGSVVIREGDQEASLLFVVTGSLAMIQTIVDTDEEQVIFMARPGEFVGELAVLTGEPSFFTVRARQDCFVVAISKTSFYSIMRQCPQVVLRIGHYVVKKLSPFVRQTDFALDWMGLEAGKAVYRQGEKSDCVYIVLNGRLRSVLTLPCGKKELMGEHGRGEIVGVVEVLTRTDRTTTVHAIRDTELAKLPSGMLDLIKRKYPQTVSRLIEILGQRLLGQVQEKVGSHALSDIQASAPVENLSTVAIVAVSDDVPISNFTLELMHSLNAIGSVLRLTKEHILQTLGGSALDSMHEYRLTDWLGQQEDLHRIVLYQADKRMTAWTQRCIRQADCILIVGIAGNDPNQVGDVEKQIESSAVRAQKELILLHREKDGAYSPPERTAEWLNARGWCVSHHHIRCPKRMFSKRSPAKVRETYERLFEKAPVRTSDFSRLARFLTGTSFGLVLGGGGARGMSQIGIMQAMEEAGIPIDMVGGTSIGAFTGALYCEEGRVQGIQARAFKWCRDMGTLWPKITDLTYPFTAMFTGRAFNMSIRDTFQDKLIEDLWIPYFNITTDITDSKMRVHTSGSLWRYTRASMSLSGYLPPLCDPKDGHLLLDGGYVNNVPADVMRSLGAQTVIAVDVGSEDDSQLTNYGDDLSGWWLLWKRWNPWASHVRVLDMSEIQSRLAYVSCMKQLEEVKNSSYCQYIRPPINRYKTMHFHKYQDLCDIGYHHGETVFEGWKKSKYLDELFKEKRDNQRRRGDQQQTVGQMPRFTDLAAMVSRLNAPQWAMFHQEDVDHTDSATLWRLESRVASDLPEGMDPNRHSLSSEEIEVEESESDISPLQVSGVLMSDGLRQRKPGPNVSAAVDDEGEDEDEN